jgi:mono/diheme cytochrome c family protein
MNGATDMSMQTPVDFTDAQRMLGASPALLQGKILRGGMGTGMPMWGSIFTEEQISDLVAYLYSFQFEYAVP